MSQHGPSTQEAIDKRKKEVEGHLSSHGNSPAAWSGVIVCLLGSLVAAIAVVAALVPVFIAGLVVMAISGPLTIMLSRMGYGGNRTKAHGNHPARSS